MTLQADSAPIIFLLVIVASVVNWIVRAMKEKAGEQETPRDTVRPARSGDSEEERMRKFLEALGIPNDAPAPAPRPAPASTPPPFVSQAPAPPSPPPIREDQPHPQPTGRRFSSPPLMPSPGFPRKGMTRLPREPALDPFPGTGKSEHPWLPRRPQPEEELQPPGSPKRALTAIPPATSELETFDAQDEAPGSPIPASRTISAPSTGTTTREAAPANCTSPCQWSGLLKDPEELRRAMVLREIFGPPRSLQSIS